jgi:hypothetical protein
MCKWENSIKMELKDLRYWVWTGIFCLKIGNSGMTHNNEMSSVVLEFVG